MAEGFGPNLDALRGQFGVGGGITQAVDDTTNPTAAKLIQSINQEIKKQQVSADEALPATRKAAEKNQYLYHYAGKSKRKQIAQGGIRGGQAQGGGKAFFFLEPEGHSISSFVNPEEMDLYRTKVTPEILDQLKVDPKLAIKDGVGSAVYLEGDLAKKGFAADLVSKNVKVGDDGIITFSKSLSVGSRSAISTRSNKIPAIALDLDKTIFKVTPEMEKAEQKALNFLKMNPEANLSLRAEAWGNWEKLAVGNLKANKEMLGFVKQLQNSGISMNVMTARSARVQEQTLSLLGKMDFIPDEVFFRPYTLEGEMEAAEKMKVGWIKKTSDKFNYISIFDDSEKTVKAALEAGVPSALQPSAKAVDKKFLQGALERGLDTMQATFSQDPKQLSRGISELESLIEIGARKNTGRMLGAASEASAAVAGGIQKSGFLRNAAAAATILGKRI